MAYTKNTWNTGDIVSSQKLNHMEDGIASAVELYVVRFTGDGETITSNKTSDEINAAINNGLYPVAYLEFGGNIVRSMPYVATSNESLEPQFLMASFNDERGSVDFELYHVNAAGNVVRIEGNA